MGKLQDRYYNSNVVADEKQTQPDEYSRTVDDGKFSVDKKKSPDDGRSALIDIRKTATDNRNMSEDVLQFRLSRQAANTENAVLNNSSENSKSQTYEKPRTPVLNYKSRINVPLPVQSKRVAGNLLNDLNSSTGQHEQADAMAQGMCYEHIDEPPTSPQRKRWQTDVSDPCIAVSESNHHVFKRNEGVMGLDLQTQETPTVLNNELDGAMDKCSKNAFMSSGGSDSSGHSEGDVYLQADVVKNGSDKVEECDTPKKGLALFIGEQSTASNSDVSL